MRTLTLFGLFLAVGLASPARAAKLDCPALAQAVGGSGQMSGTICKVSWPRSDLHVTAHGIPIPAFMGFGSWAAFAPHRGQAMVMGDLALLQSELPKVMKGLVAHGFAISAAHSHFAEETPPTRFMHYMAVGDPMKLAGALHDALAPTRDKGVTAGAPPTVKPAQTIDCAPLEKALGHKGEVKGGVCKITIPRDDLHVKVNGMAMPSGPMGISTWAAFEALGANDAVVAGDFAMTEREVNRVIPVLVNGGIDVLVVHNHMIGDTPRVMFLHYWGRGAPVDLAKDLAKALAQTGAPHAAR